MNDTLLSRRQKVLGSKFPLFYDEPLHLVRGEGVWVYDEGGRRYLDVYNNVPHVGHCHPRVVDAICLQARTLNLHTRYLHDLVVEYAELLTATFAEPLSVVSFTCTGTEANELALRMARFASGSTGIIVSDFSYHGNSATLAGATTALPAPESLAANVRAIRIPDLNHSEMSPQALKDDSLAKVREAIHSLQDEGFGVCALLVDAIFSSEGLPLVPEGYIEGAVELVRNAGGYFISDEVQPGFGRMGDHMWGHQAYSVTPDFATMGKPMGNGHPIGGVVTSADLLETFGSEALYFNTFGGNPVSAAAGIAVLEIIKDERLIENAQRVGAYLQNGLELLRSRHEQVGSVRGRGLFFGLEIVRDKHSMSPWPDEARRIINEMKKHGVLISKIGPHDNILKMRPPMVFSIQNADLLLETLESVLSGKS